MPSPIQLPGPAQALVRSLALVGRFPLSIDEMVAPVVVLSDLSEEGAQPLVRRACAVGNIVAVVAEGAVARFETPDGIGARIREVYAFDAAGATRCEVFFGSSIVAPAAVLTKAYTDGRLRASGQQPAGVVAVGTQVGGLAVQHTSLPFAANPGSIVKVDWRVGRTDAFDFVEFKLGANNSVVRFGLTWDEYEIR